ncbi:hypothetical protein FACS189425_04800 [Clostridia bacterium]|nr:hypothetical protein FACS189425_04800 [Clostridia bacterium]
MNREDVSVYIRRVSQRGSDIERQERYIALKNLLLPQRPWEEHDAICREICERLKI